MRRLTLLLVPMLVSLTGCYRPLFDENLPRNQFSQHDAARDGETPMDQTDAFGNPEPALRQRLLQN